MESHPLATIWPQRPDRVMQVPIQHQILLFPSSESGGPQFINEGNTLQLPTKGLVNRATIQKVMYRLTMNQQFTSLTD